ncbi:DUF1285 domain-containing protein [Rubellimicrobium aerolatum]|uniref:DUF1285 domain-containing protein n=1 Tax=Rubellimicrobium aerolatum TaxID=490979 RepID=A0ABW0SAM6_9RHOB|nr:DUF1285 domain-containing protein [Rubellimicrobium aerolatum]MBP1806089.1 hypothetical protein [Rubellimicrobium aerolatum]
MGKTNKSETGAPAPPPAASAPPAGTGPAAPTDTGTGPAETLLAAAQAATRRGPPPVHLWNPPHCGDIDMRIARDGTWFYGGTPIGRPAMVRLFSSILRRDPEGYVLVTPVEKVGITVDDAPFVAVDVDARDGALTFRTNVDEEVTAGPAHPLRLRHDPATGEPRPYLLVRANLEALIDRKTFHRLADLGETRPHEGADWFGVTSQDTFFPLIPAADLPDA